MMNEAFKHHYDDYDDWYVLSVQTNKELYVKKRIDEHTDYRYRSIIFSRELIHSKQKRERQIKSCLFPGYIFVHKHVNKVFEATKEILPYDYIRPISFDGSLVKVKKEEMMLLLDNSTHDGVFSISNYYKEKDRVKIIDGPLKDFKGRIRFINEKKHKVNVEVSLFNRTMNLSLGINEIRKEF